MAQDYELTQFQGSDFKDQNGNTWCTAVFRGVGEPVKWVVKDITKIQVGQSYYGEIKTQQGKSGKDYLRFYREQRPDQNHGGNSSGGKREYQPRDDSAIRAQWAIGQAVHMFTPLFESAAEAKMKIEDFTNVNGRIEAQAKELYVMVNRVKDSGTTDLKVEGQRVAPTGYEKAKQVATTLKQRTTDEVAPMQDDAETESLIASYAASEHGINLDEIPF